jgi:leucyl-tRNA synthetase
MAFHYTGTPILAMSKRVIAGDKELIDIFVKLYGVPEDAIPSFADPVNIASHFHKDLKLGMQEMGFSIDWRREFTTVKPQYSKFIEWQFHRLHAKGLITKGAHPIGWCPSCKNPVGQHDTLGTRSPSRRVHRDQVRPRRVALPAATLRPETLFGVTNLWLNPDAQYVEASFKGQRIIVSKIAIAKLKGQYADFEVIREVAASSLIGRQVTNPLTKGKVTILPAGFVDPDNATGVVMSVPAHAPYDLLALRDLKAAAGRSRSMAYPRIAGRDRAGPGGPA